MAFSSKRTVEGEENEASTMTIRVVGGIVSMETHGRPECRKFWANTLVNAFDALAQGEREDDMAGEIESILQGVGK